MDYNQFSYYRANPYSKGGYMPPIAHTNRHRPDFLTQMPMGQNHLGRIGKKQYASGIQRSNISGQHLLESPQRYPYQNRIALDKKYQRNLNTIDIEGATSGTLISQAMRNKLRARDQLIRTRKVQEQKDNKQQQFQSEQQKRRNVAMQQYLRDQQLAQMASGRAKHNNSQSDKRNNEVSNKEYKDNYHNSRYGQNDQNNYAGRARTPEKIQSEYVKNQLPRHQSIDASYLSRNNPQMAMPIGRASYNKRTQFDNQHPYLSQSNYYDRLMGNNSAIRDKKQIRMQNPTNLSSDSSIYLAGRNLINQ